MRLLSNLSVKRPVKDKVAAKTIDPNRTIEGSPGKRRRTAGRIRLRRVPRKKAKEAATGKTWAVGQRFGTWQSLYDCWLNWKPWPEMPKLKRKAKKNV